jgi:hypothetical protein
MKKIIVMEATKDQTNWLVGKCSGMGDGAALVALHNHCGTGKPYSPCTDWGHGGPIVEKHWSAITRQRMELGAKSIAFDDAGLLIGLMHCFIVSEIGDVAEVPDQLVPKESPETEMPRDRTQTP